MEALLGIWKQVFPELENEEIFIEFRDNKNLVYRIESSGKTQYINMVYSIKNDKLITDQPSHPRKETTDFIIENDGSLVLKFSGEITKYRKQI